MRVPSLLLGAVLLVWLLSAQQCGHKCYLDETDLVLGQHHTDTPGVVCR